MRKRYLGVGQLPWVPSCVGVFAMLTKADSIMSHVPAETIDWLLGEDNPAVATLTRRTLLGEASGGGEADALWGHRNEYPPIAAILADQHDDGTWDTPSRDYQKYGGSLWQMHFLGELWADGDDPRVQLGAKYAFSRQVADGSWSCNGRPVRSIQCLTANVGRALARLGFARDERIVGALRYIVDMQRKHGPLVCSAGGSNYTINGYCHMLAPKLLLFLAEVPHDAWPDGAQDVRDAAVAALRDKQVFRCLPHGSREFMDLVYSARKADVETVRNAWLAEHPVREYGDKPGWLRFGFPLSYNSDVLEALAALAAVGETRRPEYEPALQVVADSADAQSRWMMRTSFNDKMRGKVEKKGQPSKWLTLRALQVLDAFAGEGAA